MTDEQKQRAKDLIVAWKSTAYALHADAMAALLQELANAAEPEPVLVVKVEPDYWYRGHYCEGSKPYINPLEVWKLPVGTKLYTAPPAPSVPDGWQPIETAPKDNKRSLFLARFNDDGTMQAFDYDGTWQSERESWELPQVYYYWATALGKVEEPTHWMYEPEWFSKLNSAQQPAPPADLVRDAERWLSEHDLELLVTFGMQADDCDADGHTLSKEQTRRLCELGVLRNVGFGRHEMTAFGDSIFGVHFSQGISLPLQTHAEYNAAIERNKQKGGEA